MAESKPKKYTRKQVKKLTDKSCFFCQESDYALLDAHRITPGAEGGKYIEHNMLTTCANCHRRIHAGEIVVDRKYNSTGHGLYVLHCWINGEEKWLQPGQVHLQQERSL